ncbi:hypothetical protein Hdeb2414_s0008g00289701 [Helianthus debilis subsp. tardiflorus]
MCSIRPDGPYPLRIVRTSHEHSNHFVRFYIFINVFGGGKTCKFCKDAQCFDKRYHIFINHFTTVFQRIQMVYEKIMLNIQVLQKRKCFSKLMCVRCYIFLDIF